MTVDDSGAAVEGASDNPPTDGTTVPPPDLIAAPTPATASDDTPPTREDPLTQVLRSLGILPARRKPTPKPSQGDDESGYRSLRFAVDGTSGATDLFQGVQHQISGDHVTVAELNGLASFYVKLGAAGNPWIRLRAGMVIHRTFDRLTFKVAESNFPPITGGAVRGDVLVYASTGPLFVQPGPHEIGLDQTVLSFSDGMATAAGVTLFSGSPTYAGLDGLVTTGKTGGVLVLSNLDIVSPLYVTFSGTNITTTKGWPLRAGRDLILPFRSKMLAKSSSIILHTDTGVTVNYAAMLSPIEQDSFDAGSV